MSDNEIFEKPKKQKKELSEERKQALRDQLKGARKKAKENREARQNKVNDMVKSEVDNTMTETRTDIEPEPKIIQPDTPDETSDDDDIINLQMDIEEMKGQLQERTKSQSKRKAEKKDVLFKKRNQNIEDIVEKKLSERLSKLNTKNDNVSKPIEKPVAKPVENLQSKVQPVVQPVVQPPKAKPISTFSRPWWSH